MEQTSFWDDLEKSTQKPMRRVCVWCKKDLPGSNKESKEITHGICDKCEMRVMEKLK